jgi:hypothetical protein
MSGRIPARAGKLAVALVVSTAVVALTAGAASARPTGSVAVSQQRVAADGIRPLVFAPRLTIPFTTEYDAEGYYGAVKCKGKHETDEKGGYPGTETEGGRDVEHCKSTTGKPLIGLAPGEEVGLGDGWFPGSSGWNSDYDGQGATKIGYKVSANGMSFKLIAYYPISG